MPSPLGGMSNNKKWRTSEERKAVCQALCDHLSQGLSMKCWPLSDPATVKSYIEEFPEDFDAEAIADAKRKGLLFWERLGIDGATGVNKDFNATSWIYNMKNRYPRDWADRIVQEQTGKDGGPIESNVTINVKFVEPLKIIE